MTETMKQLNDAAEDLPVYWQVDLNIKGEITDKLDIFLSIKNLFNRENSLPTFWGNADGGAGDFKTCAMLRIDYKF